MSWLVILVLLAAGFAWLTRHPDAAILDQAQGWPVVGPLARGFREAYLQPRIQAEDRRADRAEDAEIVWIAPRPEDVEAVRHVWVQPGSQLYDGPDRESPVLRSEGSIRNLSVLEQRGDWYRVRVPRLGQRPLLAWVYLEDYEDPSPEALRQGEPVLPLPSAAPHPERVSWARQLMESSGQQLGCGPYSMYTDALDAPLLELCPGITHDLEEVYRQRYGVEPVSAAAEAILFFRRASAYRRFRDREEVPFESNLAHASPAAGYVALYQGERSTGDILGTLIHELTHLLNRRSLGPALPPWLSEGIADDLAESAVGEDGSLQPGKLGGESRIEGLSVTRRGAVAAAINLQEALKAGDLPSLEMLIEMDRHQFHDPERVQLHYALSSFWVRYLLSGFEPDLMVGFRAFLQDVARGTPITGVLLLERLRTDWQSLERGFRTWVHLQFLPPPNETRPESP